MSISLKNKNFAVSTLASNISISATQLTVADGDGSKFPSTGSFRAVIWSQYYDNPLLDTSREIVTMSLSSGDIFNITRAQEDTTAKAWNAGDNVALVITAGKIDEIETEINTHTAGDAATQHASGVGTHTHQSAGAQGGTLDHGLALTGLADDDHIQYLNTTRHDVVDRHPISVGGTGATTAAGARTNLGLGTSDSPTFAGETLSGLTASLPVFTDANKALITKSVADAQTALQITPVGDWTDYAASSTIVGWSSFTSGRKWIYYKVIGKIVFVWFHLEGTSNSTSVSFTLPFTSANLYNTAWGGALNITYDNGVTKTTPGHAQVTYNSNTVNCYVDMANGAWTASGTKIVAGQFFYQIA
jgi:hypothetical protein